MADYSMYASVILTEKNNYFLTSYRTCGLSNLNVRTNRYLQLIFFILHTSVKPLCNLLVSHVVRPPNSASLSWYMKEIYYKPLIAYV